MNELNALIAQTIQSIDWRKKPENLYQPIEYILSQGGKRIRPHLCLMACRMFGGDVQKAIVPAVAFEMLHNFTLIHDDIMDKADLRRGKETVYKKWNTDIAILSGDTLFAKAFEYMLSYQGEGKYDLLNLLTKTSVEICEGQQYDLDFEQMENVSVQQYLEMIRLKTSVMLAACLQAGAIVANANKTHQEIIYQFGIKIGLAFQIQDDFLDVYADVEKFGKQVGGDSAENKKTYMLLQLINVIDNQDKQNLDYYMTQNLEKQDKYQKVKALYDKYKIGDMAKQIINTYFEEAMDLLKQINIADENKKELFDFANKLMNRDY